MFWKHSLSSSFSVCVEVVMQKAEKRFQTILLKHKNSAGIAETDYHNLDVNKSFSNNNNIINSVLLRKSNILLVLILICAIVVVSQINIFQDSECIVDMPTDASKWFREPESCNICQDVNQIQKVTNVTPVDFYSDFVNLSKPVVVADGALNWPALKVFSFDFFQKLYQNTDYVDNPRKTCQFFPYKTEFKSLSDVLSMSPERAYLNPGEKPWYVGWSNCNDKVGKVLKIYYDTPYFLPNISENMALNWIFMGGPGLGAHMHVDNVQYPSWQAQLKGRKLWRLAPPPECYYKCKEVQVVVGPGEIIVVDTNRWYHQTSVLPGEISITIGSEFD